MKLFISSITLLACFITVQAICNLQSTLPDDLCECDDKNVTCTEYWPLKEQIPRGVISLTITGCNKRKLGDSKDVFGKLKNLTNLDLTNNSINRFSSAASFHHRELPNIKRIVLDFNNLTNLNYPQVFNGLTNLEVLSLKQAFNKSKEQIGNLTKMFQHSSFNSLRELYLDYNAFALLSEGMFQFDGRKASIVETISVRNCSLIALLGKTFVKEFNPELKYLDLSMNRMQLLDNGENLFSKLNQFGSQLSVNLTGNPFKCDCLLDQFGRWLNETSVNIVDKDSLVCASAENSTLIGRSITSLTSSDLLCAPGFRELDINNQLTLPYIILSVIFGIIGVLFIIVMYMRRSEIHTWVFTTGSAIKEVFCSSRAGYSDIGRAQRSEVPADMPPAEV